MDATYATLKRKREKKKIGFERDFNPCCLRYSCSALAVELTSQLVADYIEGSYTPQEDKGMEVNTVKPPCATISCKRQPPITEPV